MQIWEVNDMCHFPVTLWPSILKVVIWLHPPSFAWNSFCDFGDGAVFLVGAKFHSQKRQMIRSCWYWKAYLHIKKQHPFPKSLKKHDCQRHGLQNCHQQAILGLSKSHPTRPSGYPSDFEPWAQLATQWAPGRLAVECPVVSRICSFEGLHWWISMDGMGWDKMKLL